MLRRKKKNIFYLFMKWLHGKIFINGADYTTHTHTHTHTHKVLSLSLSLSLSFSLFVCVCLYIYIHSFLSICFSASLAKKKEKRTRKRGHQARGASVHTAAIERSQQQHRKTPQPGSSNSPSAHSLYHKVSMKKKNYATRLSNLPRAHSLYLKVLNKKKAKKSRHQARATRRVHTASILRSQ